MEFFRDSQYISQLVGFCKDQLSLIMKYYPEGSVDEWLLKQKWNIKIRVNCLLHIARGIALLHERQVAHCDLKPQNVLVEARMEVCFVLTDFGISKILTSEYLASQAFQIRNLRGLTVPYAAPDLIQRFRRKGVIGTPIEEKAGDVYAFGCIVYFILNNTGPWY
jgi:serine/threonine protein kinase